MCKGEFSNPIMHSSGIAMCSQQLGPLLIISHLFSYTNNPTLYFHCPSTPLSYYNNIYSYIYMHHPSISYPILFTYSLNIFTPMMNNSSPAPYNSTRSWSVSDDSLRRYVFFASESCIQELLSASDSNRDWSGNVNGNDGWKVLAFEDGVEISKRRSGSDSFHAFRSRWLLKSVSPEQFITVANAIDAAKQWDSDLVEARYIKDLDENLSIIRLRFGENAKPLFRNREFIVYERRETMDDGTLVVAIASLPKEMAAGLHPKQNNSIRGLLMQSGWVVEKLDDDSCMITYVVQLDPAGWLPKFFVNRFNTKLVMIIENLWKEAQAHPSLINHEIG